MNLSMRLPRTFWRWLGFSAVAALLYCFPLIALARLSLGSDDHYSHIGLIPLIFLYLIWYHRGAIFEVERRRSRVAWIPGTAALILGGLALALQSSLAPVDYLSLMGASFVAAYWAAFILAVGWEGAHRALFPLGLLLFMIPFPAFLLDALVGALLWGSAWCTDWMFRLTGTPFLHDGYTFSLPGLTIFIAEECSGIRSTLALVITGLLAGHLLLRRGWSRAALIVVLFPLSVFKNGLRIVTLSLLSIHVDRGFITGRLHHEGGIVFFLITLVVMALMIKALALLERGPSPAVRDRR